MTELLTPITRLTRDLSNASQTLSKEEARFLVDSYYMMQENRIRGDAQVRALSASEEPHSVLAWLADQNATLEKQIARALDKFSSAHDVGLWARSQKGIGPVIAAGLLAHIDIMKAPTAGHVWAYAGLDPSKKWEKGQKRPWNASLKVLCWKMGESFIKVSGNEDAFYGQVYKARKEYEIARNEAGGNAETAARILSEKKFGKNTDARKHLESGKLPPAQIHARARRYAVKMFLSHLQEIWWQVETGTKPPAPYAMAFAGHAHYIAPPNWPMKGGAVE